MNGPYCASLPEDVDGRLELRCRSGIADCIPMSRSLPFTALNVYSVDVGPLKSGASVGSSNVDWFSAISGARLIVLSRGRGVTAVEQEFAANKPEGLNSPSAREDASTQVLRALSVGADPVLRTF